MLSTEASIAFRPSSFRFYDGRKPRIPCRPHESLLARLRVVEGDYRLFSFQADIGTQDAIDFLQCFLNSSCTQRTDHAGHLKRNGSGRREYARREQGECDGSQ